MFRFPAAFLILFFLTPLFCPAQPPADPLYPQLREPTWAKSYKIHHLTLAYDLARFELTDGTITLAAPVAGRVTTAIFAGSGTLSLAPTDQAEQRYLANLLGQTTISESFRAATFRFTDDTAKRLLEQAEETTLSPQAADIFKETANRLRKIPDQPRSPIEAIIGGEDIENYDAEILSGLYNPSEPGFFLAFIRGDKHKDLRFFLRPRGAFPALPSPEEVGLLNLDPVADEAALWYLFHTQDEVQQGRASSEQDHRIAKATAYTIDTRFTGGGKLSATCTVSLQAIRPGTRVIHFTLLPDLRVSQVILKEQPLAFIQEPKKRDAGLYVILPEPLTANQTIQLSFTYAGDQVVQSAGNGNYFVGARTSWYPNLNSFLDRAHYDLTFRAPKKFTVVSVGKLESTKQEDGLQVTHWVSTEPLAVAGFNLGEYIRKTPKKSAEGIDYQIEGFATNLAPDYVRDNNWEGSKDDSPAKQLDGILTEAQAALQTYNYWFGLMPYPRIALTQQPQLSFGQSWPGLVYLPFTAYLSATDRKGLLGNRRSLLDFVQEVTPHEVAHQWWGHTVGWASYRDQWLSEGLAEYSATLYLEAADKTGTSAPEHWASTHEELFRKDPDTNLSPNDSGPISLGLRLATIRNPGGYSRLVYPKGSYILRMLRSMMQDRNTGDENFRKMMQEFVLTHQGKLASTESFLALASKYMTPLMDVEGKHNLNWFYKQYIAGTAVPTYFFDYTLEPTADGRQTLKASARQADVPNDFISLVPVTLIIDKKPVRLGQIRIIGSKTETIQVIVPGNVSKALFNADYVMLAR